MVRKAIPKPSILDQCVYLGKFKGEARWRNNTGNRIFTWDSLHGEIDVFNQRGKHLGAIDPKTGELIKEAKKGRKIDV